MKGTEKLIAHIKADADAQVNAILAQAEQQCAGIRGDFDKQAAALYAERLRAGVKETQDKVDGEARIARMEGRKELLAAKQELVSRSFRKAQEQIVSLPEEQYVAFLAKKPDDWSKGMILCITVEFYAILSLLASFMMLNAIQL